jgi:hypothetical protein
MVNRARGRRLPHNAPHTERCAAAIPISRVVLAQDRMRKLIDQAVVKCASAWAKKIPLGFGPRIQKLTPASARFDQFRDGAARALYSCVNLHIMEVYMKADRWRWGDARKAYERIAECYDKVVELILLGDTVGLPPVHHDLRFKDLPALSPSPDSVTTALLPFGLPSIGKVAREERVAKAVNRFRELAEAARAYAKACVDEGGIRKQYPAFDALVHELKLAFEQASGPAATISRRRSDPRGWDGKYFDLVEAVWQVACDIAEQVTDRQLQGPRTPKARGKHLDRLLNSTPLAG